MILHFSQIFFTDGLTFILLHHSFLNNSYTFKLLSAPGYATLCEVVHGHLDGDLVARQYSDIIHSQLSRNMSRYDMAVGKLYLEGRVRQCLNYYTFKFDNIILRQNNPSPAKICECFYQLLSTRVVIITPDEVRATVFS